MSLLNLLILSLVFLGSSASFSETEGVIKLYQVGKEGKYCVSTTGDESGCISGRNGNNELLNYLATIKGQKIEFHNLSDVVHDMRFTGANAEDMPLQRPGAEAASKTLSIADPDKQSIECSFHGSQVGVGYQVLTVEEKSGGHPGAPEMIAGRTSSGVNRNSDSGETARSFSQAQSLSPTRLADVSSFVLANGNPMEAQWLMKIRPDLQSQFPEKAAAVGTGDKNSSGTAIKGLSQWSVSTSTQLPGGGTSGLSTGGSGGTRLSAMPQGEAEVETKGNSSAASWVRSTNGAALISPLEAAKQSNSRGLLQGGLFYKGKELPRDRYFISGDTLYIMGKSKHHLDGSSMDEAPTPASARSLASSELSLPSGVSLGASHSALSSRNKPTTDLVSTNGSSKAKSTDRTWMLMMAGGLLAASTLGGKKKEPEA